MSNGWTPQMLAPFYLNKQALGDRGTWSGVMLKDPLARKHFGIQSLQLTI